MVSHGSSSDSMSLEVSGVFISILTDLDNVVVWMVSTCLFISKFSISFINSFRTVPSDQLISPPCFIAFFLLQGRDAYLSFRFLFSFFSLCGLPGRQCPLFCRFSFFFGDYH